MRIGRRSTGGTFLAVAILIIACGSDSVTNIDEDTGDDVSGGDVPAVFSAFADGIEILRDGSEIVIRTDGVPDHSSPYFNATDAQYAPYDGDNSNFQLNPNRIAEQSWVFRIPAEPSEAANKSATPLGAIGVATNGVAIFNQYAGPNQPLTFEIDSFDQFNGHPQQTGVYHYHIEPLHLTIESGKDVLVGFLLDGFPVYGPEEGGAVITNADLDEYHGHTSATPDYPDGIYHYHVTAQDPYINGAGFFGTPGSAGN
jgi:hypothetical protein